jgi:predicted ATPase/DNA-binding SARP family transcriptional activator
MIVSVQLLGTAKVNLEFHSVPFVSDKRFLLLAFLAFKHDWVSRDQLANLFWDDTDSVGARKNLRHLLSRVRALDFVSLEFQNEQVRWLVTSDVAVFQTSLASGNWQQAVAAYQGHFLMGLHSESSGLDDWLQQERESLQGAFRDTALNYAKELEAQGRFDEASATLSQTLKYDLLAEDVIQAFLRVAGHAGQRLEALKVFESFKSMLSLELGLMPLETTLQLAANLRLETRAVSQDQQPVEMLRNFPAETSSFVGRDLDLSEIAAYFGQPEIRLLTLIGAGGMGKTRLAIQVALEQAKHFSDGATFVPLASVGEASSLVPAIVSALGISVSSFETQELQLKNYLSEKHSLLVLDNFEHLLDGAGIVLELLGHCPNLRIIVTTREALNYQSEYLIDVIGLDVPKDASEKIEVFDSVQLLLRSAKRVNPRFMLSPGDKPSVIEICQMLQGSPLAIELASNWLRVLSVSEVANEIRKSLDFLSLNQPELAKRHRSIRAVFDSSWVLLTEEQKLVLSKLSLLRSGFTLESAARVANATPSLLLGLVSKSLIGRFETRFVMHETVRQYAAEHLEPAQKEAALLELSLLACDWALAVAIFDPARLLSEKIMSFEHEFENVTIALEWSLQTNPQLCANIVYLPWYFWYAAARKPLGLQWLNTLLELPALQTRDATRANLLNTRSIVGMRMVGGDQRLNDAQTALEIAHEVGDSRSEAQALLALGMALGDVGTLPRAIESLKAALALLKTAQDINLEADCRNELAFLHWSNGETELARQTFEDLIARCQVTGNKRSLANANANLAYVYATHGDLETAQHRLEQAIVFYRESLNIGNLCASLLTLGNIMFRRGNMTGVHETLLEAGKLCLQVQEAACFSCFYALSAALEQQRERHAKALRLNAIATVWRSKPGHDFPLEELEPNQFKEPLSASLFGTETLGQFLLEASGLSSKEAMQYALGQTEIFDDPPVSQSVSVQTI